jgi:hypothetical protein
MDWIDVTATLVIGLLIRVGIPVGLTALVIFWLRKMDEGWKREAQVQRPETIEIIKNIGCWEINNCPAEQRAGCVAFNQQETPCWQHFRNGNGSLRERCLTCQVFRKSPVPVKV